MTRVVFETGMQRLSTDADADATTAPGANADVRCPVCGEPIRGIAAARPGEHRFVGCDHYASARFLASYTEGVAAGPGQLRIGP